MSTSVDREIPRRGRLKLPTEDELDAVYAAVQTGHDALEAAVHRLGEIKYAWSNVPREAPAEGPTFEHVGLLLVFARDMNGKAEEIAAFAARVDEFGFDLLEMRDDVEAFLDYDKS
jgi:hypothetical protein